MDIRNDTPFESGLAIGMGADRAPCLAVVVKGTFVIPKAVDGPVEPADEQLPVLSAEAYHDGDVTGSLLYEADAVPFKPRADIALVGTVYAPGGRPASQVDVMLEVGRVRKALRVFGDRQWLFPSKTVMVPVASKPVPFVEMPLVYERAFGGIDRKAGRWFDKNFIGTGFLGKKVKASVDGRPLPNIEDPAHLITSWNDEPDPAGYGFYSPTCQPRARYGGTEEGLEQPHPLFGLAADFSHDFYNGAHPDLQVPGYLRGDEQVDLINLTRDGRRRFRLPGIRPVVTIDKTVALPAVAADGEGAEGGSAEPGEAENAGMSESHPLDVVLDTLVLLPDDGIFYQVWRGIYPLPDLEEGLQHITDIHVKMGNT